jgi:phage replication O-like protein O
MIIMAATQAATASGRKIKPFDVHRNYTAIHNAVLDFIMPRLSGSEWKVLCYIIRHTTGFQQESDRISYSQIAGGKLAANGHRHDAGAGVKSSTTISEALKTLVAAGYIFKSPGGERWEATTYTLNLNFELETGTEGAAPTPKNGVEPTPENGAPLLQKMEQADAAPTPKNGDTKETCPEKETEKHTQTRLRAVGAPAVGGVCVGSKFSLDDCRRYADHLHASGQGVTNPGGFARSIFRSGAEDEKIELFMRGTSPAEVQRANIAQCPDCRGSTLRPVAAPGDYSQGVMKCKHERLAGAA